MRPYRTRVQPLRDEAEDVDPDPINAGTWGTGPAGTASPKRASWTTGLSDLDGGEPQKKGGVESDCFGKRMSRRSLVDFGSEVSDGKAAEHRKGRTAEAAKSLRGLGQMTGRSPAEKVFCRNAHPFAMVLSTCDEKIISEKNL